MKKYKDLTEREIQKILGVKDKAIDDYKQMLYTIRSKRTTQARNYKTGDVDLMARTPINEFETQASIIAASVIWNWMSQFDSGSIVSDYSYNTSRFSFFSVEYFQTLTVDDYMDADPMDDKLLPLYDYSTAITSALTSNFLDDIAFREETGCDRAHNESYALAFIYAEYVRFIAYGFACMGAFQTDAEFNGVFKFDRDYSISRLHRKWTTLDILEKLTAQPVLGKFLDVVENDDSLDIFLDKQHIPFLVEFTQHWNRAIGSWTHLLDHLRTSPFPISLGLRHERTMDNNKKEDK